MTLSIQAHGARIEMDDTGGKISRCFRKGVPYEKPLLEYIYQQQFTGLAVDAGANIGNHTLWFAKVCGLDVAAFEPLQYELLRKHVAMNDADDMVQIHPVGLGSENSTAVHVGKGRFDPEKPASPSGSNRPNVDSGKWVGTGFVATIRTLDSFDLKNVSMIKADVEGMEAHVFQGGEETIRCWEPTIFAETWGDKEHNEIAGVLEPWGYRVTNQFTAKISPTPIEEWRVTK